MSQIFLGKSLGQGGGLIPPSLTPSGRADYSSFYEYLQQRLAERKINQAERDAQREAQQAERNRRRQQQRAQQEAQLQEFMSQPELPPVTAHIVPAAQSQQRSTMPPLPSPGYQDWITPEPVAEETREVPTQIEVRRINAGPMRTGPVETSQQYVPLVKTTTGGGVVYSTGVNAYNVKTSYDSVGEKYRKRFYKYAATPKPIYRQPASYTRAWR